MVLSNRDRVDRSLQTLAEGLAPFVDRHMQAATQGPRPWLEVWGDGDGGRTLSLDDPQVLLRSMTESWRAFERTLGRNERSWASELRETRNRWAHGDPFSADDTYRALDTTERLLSSVSAGDLAAEVRRSKEDLQRLRYETETRKAARGTGPTHDAAVGGLTPWREVAIPHPDVAEGRFAQAEFAADLAQVARGEGAAEYADPAEFFRRTFLTDGLATLLVQAAQRVAGDGAGVPIVDLQTNFGGGKTHSLIALYHLFSGRPLKTFPAELQDLLREHAGIEHLPRTRRVVLAGQSMSPGAPDTKPDGTVVRTMWGELAWQLGGREAFELVAEADATSTNPGDALRVVLKRHAPCLILIDEWIAYARELFSADGLPAGSFDTQFTFAQNLTESVRAVPGVLLVLSIPASDRGDNEPTSIEIGGTGGQEALRRLQNVVRRMDSPWRPASAEESFEIVRRRLFEPIAPDKLALRDGVARRCVEYYREHRGEFPSECSEPAYERRILDAYPLHPELFARLYEDWSTLERFQRTRGVLRLMAKVVNRLWESGDQAPLVLPGGVPLSDAEVEGELTRNLDDNWKPIIDADVDGDGSLPAQLDAEKPQFGQRQAARRVARTVFLGSAPTALSANRGLEEQRVRLGCALPGETPAVFGDALRGLAQRATYLYADGPRYWYSVQPSVNRKAADLAERFRGQPDVVQHQIVERLRAAVGSRSDYRTTAFSRVHPAPATSAEVPDEPDARLVVLHPQAPHVRQGASRARDEAERILWERGSARRTFRNALVFLAADAAALEDLEHAVRDHLAWQEIVDRADEFNLDPYQRTQAQRKLTSADQAVDLRLSQTYRWLLLPSQPDPAAGDVQWQTMRMDGDEGLVLRASRKLRDADLLRTQMTAQHVRMDLDGILAPLWGEGWVSVQALWSAYASYPYLARLRDVEVLLAALRTGPANLLWREEGFALAPTFDEGAGVFRGLITEAPAEGVTTSWLVVHPALAQAQLDTPVRDVLPQPTGIKTPEPESGHIDEAPVVPAKPRRFHAAVALHQERLGREFGKVSEEVLTHLKAAEGVKLTVTIEVQATSVDGFDDRTISIVRENASALRFETWGFEDR